MYPQCPECGSYAHIIRETEVAKGREAVTFECARCAVKFEASRKINDLTWKVKK